MAKGVQEAEKKLHKVSSAPEDNFFGLSGEGPYRQTDRQTANNQGFSTNMFDSPVV